MSDYTLSVPEEIYDRARQIAEETSRPVEQVLIESLRSLLEPLAALPADEQQELHALRLLSDDTLGTIDDEAYTELERYVERGNRLMVRKAEAAGILMERRRRIAGGFRPPH